MRTKINILIDEVWTVDPTARALLLEGFVGGLWDGIEGDDQGVAELARAALKAVA